ncbi:MAG TPA: winged helix-turn-helix domain-containing protein [Streptosporangiaceae bacterium]|jgi:DNA-binding transcriptional ArsR family regulator
MEDSQETALSSEAELLAVLIAVANPLRLRVIAALAQGRVHVSELARRLGMSRPLLYMHLDKLEKAGLVTGHLELSDDGKAMKYFELAPFELRLTAETIIAALSGSDSDGDGDGDSNGAGDNGEANSAGETGQTGEQLDDHMKESDT